MKIAVRQIEQQTEINVSPGARLLDYLQSEQIPVNAACGGKGTCHKCRIKLHEGFLAATASDRKAFTESQIQQGWRLSCQARPRGNICVALPSAMGSKKTRILEHAAVTEEARVVCDLGSTGIVLAVIDDKKVLWEAHALNPQIQFGADVMTRLAVAQVRGLEALQESLLTRLESLLALLPKNLKTRQALVSGNSAMMTFMLGWDFARLAVDPYQPAKLDEDSVSLPSGWVLKSLPLLGGFVGGDTFAGIIAIEEKGKQAPWMLVDIGTNTEIVLKTSKGEYFFASAPAGPAFEGGNITYGMRGEPGAIEHAKWQDGKWQLNVIGNDMPVGICGSGLIDLLSESVKHNLVHSDGFVPEGSVEIVGEVSLLADDVREFQLAKSATRTGIEVVIRRAGEMPREILLAGSFAEHLDLSSVDAVGLLPKGISARAIGNASLSGASIYARMTESEQAGWRKQIRDGQRQIELALQEDFQELFVKNLELQ